MLFKGQVPKVPLTNILNAYSSILKILLLELKDIGIFFNLIILQQSALRKSISCEKASHLKASLLGKI